MTTIRRILVPVDFSRESAEALKIAADFARRYEAALEIVHVLHVNTYALPAGYVVPTPEQFALMVEQAEGQLAQAKQAALDAGAPQAETKLLQGYPTNEIVCLAKEQRFDLIVMGTHGRTGVKHLLVGSVAENVARLAPCAVLTTRAPAV